MSKRLLVAFLGCVLGVQSADPAPFTVQGEGVNPNDFRITTFASGLDFPLGMARLADGSLLVTINEGANFFNATGKLLRLTDANEDGVADGSGTVLYTGLPGGLTAVRVAGNLVFATGQGNPIAVLRVGAAPADQLTFIGQIVINYPGSWYHPNSALGLRKTPGKTNAYDLLFQLGSDSNFAVTTQTATLSNNNVPGASGILHGDSFYMLTVEDHSTNVTATNLTQVASGLRNPAGFAFHPATGDLYFQDNGIDSLQDFNEPLSADELNFIARTNLGGPVEYFGFPNNYTEYRTGTQVGNVGIQPLIAFQPLPNPSNGRESEGANDVVFAPPGFPDGLNTGVFVAFHGRFNSGGTNNDENPLVYADPVSGRYFHFIEGRQPGIGHLDGLLATGDSLFVADLVSTGDLANGARAGAIYQIKALASPSASAVAAKIVGAQVELTWERGTLQQAAEVTGPWNDVRDAFSPYMVDPVAPRKFFRARY